MTAARIEFLESKLNEAAEHIRSAQAIYSETLDSFDDNDEETTFIGIKGLRKSAGKLILATDQELVLIRFGYSDANPVRARQQK